MTNAYDSTRGNVTDRERRRKWLLETYRADVDVITPLIPMSRLGSIHAVPFGEGEPACRCYRCGKLLTLEMLTVDRIIPGCKGGTYRRNNIRPSCSDCANKQGGRLSAENRSNSVPVVRPDMSVLAARYAQAGRGSAGNVSVPDVQAASPRDIRRNGKVE